MVQYRRFRRPGATVFFTVCLAREGSSLLTDEIDTLRLAVGCTLRERPVEVLAWTVLPDRMHAIWKLPEGDCDYARRWGAIKGRFSRSLREAGQSPALREPRAGDAGIWQKRFWEHHIRGPQDLLTHLDLCRMAPVEAGFVTSPTDWPFSSFHKRQYEETTLDRAS